MKCVVCGKKIGTGQMLSYPPGSKLGVPVDCPMCAAFSQFQNSLKDVSK